MFSEYTKMLLANDPSIQEYLNIQNYEEEIRHLETKYGMPKGRLYLAIRLYQAYGFYEIASYNNSPMDTSIYMKLDL